MSGHGVVTIGETMAMFASTRYGPLQHTATMNLGVGGSVPGETVPQIGRASCRERG